MKRFDKANSDFETAIRLNPTCGLGRRRIKREAVHQFNPLSVGFMGKADCLRFMGEYEMAVSVYTEALAKDELEEKIGKVAILKRAITYIEAKSYEKAVADLSQVDQGEMYRRAKWKIVVDSEGWSKQLWGVLLHGNAEL